MSGAVEILATERLRLRTATLDDAPFFLALLNDPGFLEHIGDRGVHSEDDARRALAEGPIAMQRERGHASWIVTLRECGTPVGTCGLIKRPTLPGVDLGYAFLDAYRGRGYAHEAAAAVLALAPRLGLAQVLAITTPGNAASNGLLRKLGMRFERVVHLVPGDQGTNLYSIDVADV
jgi:RimJ/RimL family protein N-acetyltransferase